MTSDEQGMGLGLAPVADGKDPASGEPDPVQWLGHRDLCPTQWGEPCTCDPAVRWCGSMEPHGFHIWGNDEYVCDGDER